MNGRARLGGVDGRVVFCGPGTKLTLEPTQPRDPEVYAWVWANGAERPGFVLNTTQLRDLAADLLARADVIDAGGAQ